MAEEKTGGYRRKWPKWLAIYLVIGAVVYAIVYFVFLNNGGGGYGGGGGSQGHYTVLTLPFLRPAFDRLRAGR